MRWIGYDSIRLYGAVLRFDVNTSFGKKKGGKEKKSLRDGRNGMIVMEQMNSTSNSREHKTNI